MKKIDPLSYFLIVIFSCLTLCLGMGCTKENMEDDRPDFIFQGTLTEITDGTPKTGWDVFLWEQVSIFNEPPGFVPVNSFGSDTISNDGRFNMDVNAFSDLIREGNSPFENTPDEKQAYYLRHRLFFRAPGLFNDLAPNDRNYIFLDPDDVDLQLDEFDFSRKGEVITRDMKIFTGDRAWVTYRYLIERTLGNEGVFYVETSFRDLAFNKPYLTIRPNIFMGIEAGVQYERKGLLPVDRPIEGTTSFKTITAGNNQNIVVLDSLIFRDTFLLQSAADTLQLRDYTY
ncbi:hypothetical protein [Neolewinella persica]|uniref:hypothetical protein n=1 Tax=Neolewinella persica TaxID=70998 RepID=UPI00037E591C|nr:hypothetical protein [Neolewinella persica]